jgi:hypothetical protein
LILEWIWIWRHIPGGDKDCNAIGIALHWVTFEVSRLLSLGFPLLLAL